MRKVHVNTLRETSRGTMKQLDRIAMTSLQRSETQEDLRKAALFVDVLFATVSLTRTAGRAALVLTRRFMGGGANKRSVVATVRRLNRAVA